ncbi:MAG: alpha/beta hydrolase, partial [Actinomycetota bacterium]|nr:alpha/beta hydrolase [Actinomycetota bacterium]
LSLQLEGTGIREVVIEIGDFSFDALFGGPSSGEPIMLLHGFPNTNYQWREQIVVLAEAGFFVVAPNQRGYSSGARPTGIESYTSEKLVKDVRGIADALLWESFHLAGHDWGAFIAWEFAGKYPDRLRTLIPISVPHPEAFAIALADPNGIQSEMSSYVEFFQQAESTSAFLTDNASLLKNIYESAGLSIEEMEPYLKVLGKPEALDAALNWYRANSFSLPLDQATNRRSDTPDIETPTMYIWSTEDTALGRQGAELTSSFVSGEYRYEVFEGVNHWITEIAAKQLNSVMLDFLSEKVKRVE